MIGERGEEQGKPAKLTCLCEECGKVYCNAAAKPCLKWRTNYRNNYRQFLIRPSSNTTNIIKPKRIKTEQVDFSTEYSKTFTSLYHLLGTKTYKPSQSMEQSGPFQCLTTYGTNYIGHHGANQYVKPAPEQPQQAVKFKGKSAYQSHYPEQHRAVKVEERAPRAVTQESETDKKIARMTCKSSYQNFFAIRKQSQTKRRSEKPSRFMDESVRVVNPESSLIHQVSTPNYKFGSSTVYQQEFQGQQRRERSRIVSKMAFLRELKHENREAGKQKS